ncbi:MAG: sugar ABC transporter [Pseudomonadota bacterium]
MIYTVECAFTDPAREEEWNAHYSGEKLDNLLRLPGWLTSQRFRALTPIDSPYFAMHSLRDAEVLGPQYTQVGGGVFGGWEDKITNWHRNLFAGLDVAPDVLPGTFLVALAELAHARQLGDTAVTWLDGCGLDRSIPMLGIAVVDRALGERLAADESDIIRVYEPIMRRKVSALEEPL